ncbi:MAG: hypothetical protein JWO09_3154 [Bacteroidetes bacterium]|nr:hypothetical protein [Bacteroidota bacterium]
MIAVVCILAVHLLLNYLLDVTGLLKKHLSSNGAFLICVSTVIWLVCSLFIFTDVFAGFFAGDFWAFFFFPLWLVTAAVGPVFIVLTQLLYSFVIRKFLIKSPE